MKSKRAKAQLNYDAGLNRKGYMVIELFKAKGAVELAEQDARERAARAFCASCPMSEQPPCMCLRKTEFLKHYDDEQG
jgi:hypothetical protein